MGAVGPAGRAEVDVVLISYHGDAAVAARVAALRAAGFCTTVVDNSGTYAGAAPDRLLRPGANLGFGAAVNLAAVSSPAPVLVLHNPDADVDPVDLDRLVARLRSQHQPGAVAPRLEVPGGGSVLGYRRPRPLREALTIPLRVAAIRAGRSPRRPRRLPAAAAPAEGRFGSGALLVLDRQAFLAVGGFDERLFLYAEDLALWTALEAAGFDVELVPDVVAHHASATGSPMRAADRELLRWLGVELWLAERSGSWRLVRAVHRLLLTLLPASGDLRAGVRSLWRQGGTPAEVLEVLAPQLRADRLAGLGVEVHRLGWSRTKVAIPRGVRVLDVGAGAFPSDRADVCCDRSLAEDAHRNDRSAVVDRPYVIADATALPFRDGAFDFVIASHLAEHVEDPAGLCVELQRVASAGYLETPSPLGDALLPEEYHRWRVSRRGSRLVFRSRRDLDPRGIARGERFYFLYNAGRGSGKATATLPGGLSGRVIGFVLYAIRGVLNRSGIMHTRRLWSRSSPLVCDVVEPSGS